MDGCELRGYPHKCGGPRLHLHHLINYSKARGNKEVRAILKDNYHEITSWVCANANGDRTADETGAQSWLLEKKVAEFGYSYMRYYLNEYIGQHWKIPRPELTLEALLAAPTDSAD